MKVGTVIEFSHGGQHLLGWVCEIVGGKKLVVHTETGSSMRPAKTAVTRVLALHVDVHDREGGMATLSQLRQEIAALRTEVEMELLWEMALSDDEMENTTEGLVDAYFGTSDDLHSLAMAEALRHDSLYFRQKKEAWQPRTEKQVSELRHQQSASEAKDRKHQAMLDTLAQQWAAPGDRDDWRKDEACRRAIRWIEGLATEGENHDKMQETHRLIDDLEERIGERIPGRGSTRGFRVMQGLGLWTEHENVARKRLRLERHFSQDLLDKAKSLATEPLTFSSTAVDLRSLWTCSIDDAQTRDIDDALSIAPGDDGRWWISVHIANPSAVVPLDSPLDEEARLRAATLYLPESKSRMFPPVLSEGVMSLVEGEDRHAITTEMEMTATGEVLSHRIMRSIVRVDQRLTYEQADRLLSAPDNADDASIALRKMHELSLETERRRNLPTFAIELPEVRVEVSLDDDPPSASCRPIPRSTSRNMVGEWMILNNRLIAAFLNDNAIPAMYRIQPPPDESNLRAVEKIPAGPARSMALIKSMGRSVVSTQPAPHYGLGVDAYVQASSPIRRYVDLATQRQLLAHLDGKPYPYDRVSLEDLVVTAERTCQEITLCERLTKRYWTLYCLQDREEPTPAVVLSTEDGQRTSVILLDFATRAKCKLSSKVEVGDKIEVVIDRCDARQDLLIVRQWREPSAPAEPTT